MVRQTKPSYNKPSINVPIWKTPVMPQSPGKELPIKQMPGGKGQLRKKLQLDAINRKLQG